MFKCYICIEEFKVLFVLFNFIIKKFSRNRYYLLLIVMMFNYGKGKIKNERCILRFIEYVKSYSM